MKALGREEAVLLLSGGLDSTVLLYDFRPTHCLLVDYGQKHVREISFAKRHAGSSGAKIVEARIASLHGSTLTGDSGNWVVPCRNSALLSLAANVAESLSIPTVLYACNADDSEMFPDCRGEFVDAFNRMLSASGLAVLVAAPYLNLTKREIVQRGRSLGVDIEATWSCYSGELVPCGHCPACKKRCEALQRGIR